MVAETISKGRQSLGSALLPRVGHQSLDSALLLPRVGQQILDSALLPRVRHQSLESAVWGLYADIIHVWTCSIYTHHTYLGTRACLRGPLLTLRAIFGVIVFYSVCKINAQHIKSLFLYMFS